MPRVVFLSTGGVAKINVNMSCDDFAGVTSTISTFMFKIIGQIRIK